MDPQTIGLYGGIAGAVIGVLGGIAGTAAGVLNTHGPRERAFAVRCAALTWAAMATALGLAALAPGPFRSLGILPVFLAMPWAIRAGNRRLQELRREDAAEQAAGHGL